MGGFEHLLVLIYEERSGDIPQSHEDIQVFCLKNSRTRLLIQQVKDEGSAGEVVIPRLVPAAKIRVGLVT